MTETREQKAQRLVDEGRVDIIEETEYAIQASVNADQRRYLTILYPNGRFWCECEWSRYHPNATDLCAHALAVKLAAERSNP